MLRLSADVAPQWVYSYFKVPLTQFAIQQLEGRTCGYYGGCFFLRTPGCLEVKAAQERDELCIGVKISALSQDKEKNFGIDTRSEFG